MGKGGGGGGGDGGAAAREAARRSRISSNIASIKERFYNPVTGQITAGRQALLDDVGQRVEDRYLPEFQDESNDAKRELKFALARRGLLGGSAQADAEGRYGDRIAKGERDISNRVLAGKAEQERLDNALMDSLINQANADADRDVLLSGIVNQQNTNANNATARINQNTFPNLFSDVSTLFKKINDTAQFNRGLTGNNPYGNLFGGSNIGLQNSGSASGSTGTVT
jgi:hypothetical protein